MSKVINLNTFRKKRAREERRARADQNAILFGRTKGQKYLEKNFSLKAKKHLDGHILSDTQNLFPKNTT